MITRRDAMLAVAASRIKPEQQLPAGWQWDQSIQDYPSLKRNLLRLAEKKAPITALFAVLGDIETVRRTTAPDYIAKQAASGWIAVMDHLVLKGQAYLPFQEIMIRQRDRISECIHRQIAPPHRLRYLDPIMATRESMVQWIETMDWRYPWHVGNVDMDTAYAMAFDWKVMGNGQAGEALEVWFDWHNKHIDPKTGFWDFGHTGEPRNCMAGAMHQFAIYFMAGRELPYHEKAVEATLKLQEPNGLFSPDTYGHNCLDIDAAFVLANIWNRYRVRERPIRATLERMHEANLKCFLPDGGAVSRGGLDKTADWWSTWCRTAVLAWSARILGMKEYDGPWDFRPRHPFQSEKGGAGLPDWREDAWYAAADWPRPGNGNRRGS